MTDKIMGDKINLVISTLEKRLGIVRKAEDACRKQGRTADAEYYLGKGHGYEQAIDLLGESVESIGIELFEDNNGNEGHTAT
jgi:hypothetical protein